jgi:hydroxyacylglutathione hydrolase
VRETPWLERATRVTLRGVEVVPVACLKDNYAYLLVTGGGSGSGSGSAPGRAVVVDPSEAAPVEAALQQHGLELEAIWLTHHHWDHVGGIEALCAARGALPVIGSAYDLEHARIPRQTRGLREGDAFELAGERVQVIEIPGHTLGAIAYVVAGCLFSGDTLFVAGCGRVFEGTMAMMQASMAKLRALPPETAVYCGHEYTLNNLRFAAAIEPGSSAIAARQAWASALRDSNLPTVPARLGEELDSNPFLRWDVPAVIAAAQARGADGTSPASVFGAIRTAKDQF